MQPGTSPLYNQFKQYHDPYTQQIKNQYFDRKEAIELDTPFLAMHSDYLNLQVKPDGSVWSKTIFLDGEVLMEIRGMVTREEQLKQLLKKMGRSTTKYDCSFGQLLWVDFKKKILLRPRGISQSLLKSSLKNEQLSTQRKQGNCYIDPHFGSKLLIKAKQTIPRDEELLIDHESMTKFIYI